MRFARFWRIEDNRAGPPPGDGADIHSGPDVEGTAPDELPPRTAGSSERWPSPVDELWPQAADDRSPAM